MVLYDRSNFNSPYHLDLDCNNIQILNKEQQKMKKCFKCKKFIWFWQQESDINIAGHIHNTCHAESLRKYINDNPDMEQRLFSEINRFEKSVGTKCNLDI